jgi:DNA-binding ferritin-like protein
LHEHLNPMLYEAAAEMVKDLAEDLRRAGYTAMGGY